jgi:hypothetical protein
VQGASAPPTSLWGRVRGVATRGAASLAGLPPHPSLRLAADLAGAAVEDEARAALGRLARAFGRHLAGALPAKGAPPPYGSAGELQTMLSSCLGSSGISGGL